MRVLLVDHDSEALETITRAIRGVLELDCVTSKGDALLLLRQNTYDVLIACERCVDGSGLDLLARTTRTAVPLKRIFAAAAERLQLLGPRLAPFKVQRTISYPIDLEELWLAIAQVTSGPNEETDGTIERVVLDERGIPSAGTEPRAPIPPRPPSPLRAVAPPPPPSAMVAGGGGRTATARMTQPAPEPPLRPPPPPRAPPAPAARAPAPPRTTSDTGRMRAPLIQQVPAPAANPDFPSWEPEMPGDDELAQVAAQARFGVQQKTADDASRRKFMQLAKVGVVSVVVAGTLVYAFEKFYDPEARAREQAITQEKTRMAEQTKVTDGLAMIEVDIETAITNNDLDTARRELATLVEKAPDHPRLEFLRTSIERAEALARLSAQSGGKSEAAEPVQKAASTAVDRTPAKPKSERSAERTASRSPRKDPPRSAAAGAPPSRSFGAPIGESPRQSLPLNAPINAAPVTTVQRSENSFPGRTREASDFPAGGAPSGTAAATAPAQPPVTTGSFSTTPSNSGPSNSGSAAVPMPNVAPPAPAKPPPPVDVVPAKIVKRVAPMASADIPKKTKGYVVLRYNIGVNGRVTDLEVVESEPQGVFDEAALDAVRKWTYEPRKENGVAVESTAKARLVFDAAN